MSWVSAPFTDRPRKTSAPSMASARVRASVSTAWADFHWFMPFVAAAVDHARCCRPRCSSRARTPMAFISSSEAMPAAPAPHSTSLMSSSLRPVMCAGVDQAGRRDDRRAVLVVVEHRDVEQLLQLGLDAEALGALDVLQIDAAEGDADVLDHGDDLVGVLGGNLDVDGIDVGEALEQHRLAFHHRLGGQGAQVAQAQDRGAVGDHRHQVALGGVVVGEVRIARRSPAPAPPRPANRPGDRSRWVAIGLVATTAILPGVGYLWNARASSSVKVRFSASLMGRQSSRKECGGRRRPGEKARTLVAETSADNQRGAIFIAGCSTDRRPQAAPPSR